MLLPAFKVTVSIVDVEGITPFTRKGKNKRRAQNHIQCYFLAILIETIEISFLNSSMFPLKVKVLVNNVTHKCYTCKHDTCTCRSIPRADLSFPKGINGSGYYW